MRKETPAPSVSKGQPVRRERTRLQTSLLGVDPVLVRKFKSHDEGIEFIEALSRSATLQEGGLPSYEQLHQPAMLSSTTTGEFADGPRPA